MSQKLGRSYQLTVSGDNFPIPLTVTLPFSVEFDITRNTLTSANLCKIRLYNLSTSNRNNLRRSVTTGFSNPQEYVVLRAGYTGYNNTSPNPGGLGVGSNLPIIFSGNVTQAWSHREGINYITELECYDSGYAYVNGDIPAGVASFLKNTPYKVVIETLISSLPNVTLGAVGNYPGFLPKDITYSGTTVSVLNELTGGGFFIDNGKGYALTNNDYNLNDGPVFQINASTGLLNTPVLENGNLSFDMVFEPTLNIGSGVVITSPTLETSVQSQLISQVNPQNQNYSGFYIIKSVKHRGTISQTVCGDCITTGLFFFLKTPVPAVPGV